MKQVFITVRLPLAQAYGGLIALETGGYAEGNALMAKLARELEKHRERDAVANELDALVRKYGAAMLEAMADDAYAA